VNAQASASLDLNIDMAVDLAYTIANAEFIFPPNSKIPGGGKFAPADTCEFLSFLSDYSFDAIFIGQH
jgi:hypothetical protein